MEKEAKIKPFAKAGLEQKEKLDPIIEAKHACEQWLSNCIATLAEQIEKFEVETFMICLCVARWFCLQPPP